MNKRLLLLVALSILLVSCEDSKNANIALKETKQQSALLGTQGVDFLADDDTPRPRRRRRDTEELKETERRRPSRRVVSDRCDKDVAKTFDYQLEGGSGRLHNGLIVGDEVVIDRDSDREKIERSGVKVKTMTYTIEGKYCDDGSLDGFGRDIIQNSYYDLNGDSISALIKLRLEVETEDGCFYTLRGRD